MVGSDLCLYLRVAQVNKCPLKIVGFCLGKEVKGMLCDMMMKGICGQVKRNSTNIMEVWVQRGGHIRTVRSTIGKRFQVVRDGRRCLY